MIRTLVLAIFLSLLGCSESAVPTGPPHCEPPDELLIERALKRGYRAAIEQDLTAADAAFDEALRFANHHPEALAGKRLIDALRRGHGASAPEIEPPIEPPPPEAP